jgi:hypothetical protein
MPIEFCLYQGLLDCDGTLSGNPGCGITEWSRASYGPYFDSQGGGVFAMKWDDEGIAVCEFFSYPNFFLITECASSGNFYRAAIPQDITDGQSPNPSTWGKPGAELSPIGCDPIKFFTNHSIIFGLCTVTTNLFSFLDAMFSPRHHILR